MYRILILSGLLVSQSGLASLAQPDATCNADRIFYQDMLRPPFGSDKVAYLTPSVGGDTDLQKAYVYRISGNCVARFKSVRAGFIQIEGGGALDIPIKGGKLLPVELGNNQFLVPSYIPSMPGLTLKQTIFVQAPNRYIGLWQSGDRSVIAAFADSPSHAPKIVATSKLPIKSVSYAPAPDSSAGTLDVLLRPQRNTTLARYRWDHSKLHW